MLNTVGQIGLIGAVRGGGVSLLQQVLAVSGLQAIYDPSDLTSIYQSRTGGSTGAVGSVVGIMLDKSRMGGLSAAAFIAGQPELVTNGGFDADASWTKNFGSTISGGALNLDGATSIASGNVIAEPSTPLSVTAGAWYSITYTIVGGTTLNISSTIGGALGEPRSAAGTYTDIIRATTTANLTFNGRSSTGARTGSIDNVSVKAIPGYHALAPSDAARPILRQSGSTYYLDADGTDDWMQIFPTLNLGEQWWHVGGWDQRTQANEYIFALSASASGRGGVLWTSGGHLQFKNASDTFANLMASVASANTPYVVTIEDGTQIAGRLNGVGGTPFDPYDDSGAAQGLALFSARSDSFSSGIGGRFYGGAFGTGTLSSSDRALLERYVAGLTGVVL